MNGKTDREIRRTGCNKSEFKNYVRIVISLLCIAFVLPIALVSCGGEDESPMMTMGYVAAVADKGMNTSLADITKFQHEVHGTLYEFPLTASGFTMWAYYDAVAGQLDYVMLSCDFSEDKLYIFYRDSAKLEQTQQKYDGPADSADVYDFVEKMTKEDK